MSDEVVTDLTEEQLLAVLDERCRRFLGISGEEFAERLDEGTLPKHGAVTHLAMLLGADVAEDGTP